MGARDNVPQMADDGVDDEHLAMLIEIKTPGIRHAVEHRFYSFGDGVKSPDTGVDFDSLRIGGFGGGPMLLVA